MELKEYQKQVNILVQEIFIKSTPDILKIHNALSTLASEIKLNVPEIPGDTKKDKLFLTLHTYDCNCEDCIPNYETNESLYQIQHFFRL